MLRPRVRRRPRYPIRANRWLPYLAAHPAPSMLSRPQREHLAGVLVALFQDPLPFREDPGFEDAPIESMRDFRPAPMHRWAPTELPFALCWPQHTLDDIWEQAREAAEENWEPLYAPPRISREGAAVVVCGSGTGLRLFADRLELLDGHLVDDEYDEFDRFDDDQLLCAAAALTDWTVLDAKQMRAFEPVACARCQRRYELSVDNQRCPRCSHDIVWVIGPEAPAPDGDAPARLLALLVEAGWVVLGGEAASAAKALDGLADADAAIDALVTCPAVEEVLMPTAWLQVILDTW